MINTDMQHKELSYPERQFLELRILGKWSLRRIAEEMNRDHSALSREVRRNCGLNGRYRAIEAEKKSKNRIRRRVRGRKLNRDRSLAMWVEEKIREGWSPETCAGRLKKHPPSHLIGKYVSHETIYQWIYGGEGRFGGLCNHLWSKRKRRYVRHGRKAKIPQIEGRIPISERPDDELPGHLESDSMIWSNTKGLLSVQVDRLLQLCRLRWCMDHSAQETVYALQRTAETLPREFVRDVTFDNGTENTGHLTLNREYGISTYFCTPHAPWQKPIVENLNRVIRHWIPRKTKVSIFTDRDWHDFENWLNNLPRKSLEYLTPNEALNQYLSGGATRT